jgi:hypothetical protein
MTAQELPLRRYFLFVGGGLLALLFLLDAVLPPPARQRSASGPNFPVIRIHSELKETSSGGHRYQSAHDCAGDCGAR